MRISAGAVVFGLGSLGSGLVGLMWRGAGSVKQASVTTAAVGLAVGGAVLAGAAVASLATRGELSVREASRDDGLRARRWEKIGAGILAAAYLVFVALTLPGIFTAPGVYESWGNFFEQFSLLTGAAMVWALWGWGWPREKVGRVGGVLMGLCAASFAAQQAVLLQETARLVPRWVPPGQKFWAVATTVFFVLAAAALVVNWMALLASRLLTAMVMGFGLMVWVPLLFLDRHSHGIWSETAETFAIAGAAWILAEILAMRQGEMNALGFKSSAGEG